MKILIIEDNKELALTVQEELKKDYLVEFALSGEEGEYLAQVNEYGLILLDLVLPDVNGLEICKKLRFNNIKTPILMLTAQDDLETKVLLLDCGADDYLVKPFNFKELKARIRAITRRNSITQCTNLITVGSLALDPISKLVTVNGQKIRLRRKEFDLLEFLMRNPGKVLSRNTILGHVWDSAYDLSNNTVDVHIKYLRNKLDKKRITSFITTIHGFGYKLEPNN